LCKQRSAAVSIDMSQSFQHASMPQLTTEAPLRQAASKISVKKAPNSDSSWCLCSKRKCFISIWTTWYCLLIVVIHVYLLVGRFGELFFLVDLYMGEESLHIAEANPFASSLRNLTRTRLRLNESLKYEIMTRIILLAASILFLLLFLFTSLKQIGNYGNDGVKFGRDFFNEKLKHRAQNKHQHRHRHHRQSQSKQQSRQASSQTSNADANRLNVNDCRAASTPRQVEPSPRSTSSTNCASSSSASAASTALKQTRKVNCVPTAAASSTSSSSTAATCSYVASSSSSILSRSSSSDSNTLSSLSSVSPRRPCPSGTKCCKRLNRCVVQPFNRLMDTVWSHFLPTSSFFHLLSILALVFVKLIFNSDNNYLDTSLLDYYCQMRRRTNMPTMISLLLLNDNELNVEQAQSTSFDAQDSCLFRTLRPSVDTMPLPPLSSSIAAWLLSLAIKLNEWQTGATRRLHTALSSSASMGASTITSGSVRHLYDSVSLLNKLNDYQVEIVSLIAAMITMYIRHGSVYWFTNKTLSFLITFIGFIASIQQLFLLYSFSFIFRYLSVHELFEEFFLLFQQHGAIYTITAAAIPATTMSISLSPTSTNEMPLLVDLINSSLPIYFISATDLYDSAPIVEPMPLTAALIAITNTLNKSYLIRSKIVLLLLYAFLSLLVYFSTLPAYAFAYLKYKERFLIEEALFIRNNTISKQKIEDQRQKASDINAEYKSSSSRSPPPQSQLPLDVEQDTYERSIAAAQSQSCCFNYCPHLIAIIQLIMICSCKIPFCYDYIIYFNDYKDLGIMLTIINEIVHVILLLFIWLLLTFKNDWTMHLQTSFSICHWTYHSKMNKRIKGSKKNLHSQSIHVDSVDFLVDKKQQPQLQQHRPTAVNDSTIYTARTAKNTTTGNPNENARPFVIYDDTAECRHSSLLEDKKEPIFNGNSNQLATTNDYLLNSETMYRDEIRKSIKNVLQTKRCSSSTAPTYNSLNNPQSNSINSTNNQLRPKNYPIMHSNSLVGSNSFYYHQQQQPNHFYELNNDHTNCTLPITLKSSAAIHRAFNSTVNGNANRRLVGSGVYLTSTTAPYIDPTLNPYRSATVKLPTITTIMTSTICANDQQMSMNEAANGNFSQQDLQKNQEYEPALATSAHQQPVIYLDRSLSAEYESRV
jgi:hypothetical protein